METELDGHRIISFQSEKIFVDMKSSKVSPYRVPPIDFVPKPIPFNCSSSSTQSKEQTKKKKNRIDSDAERASSTPQRQQNTPKNVSSLNEKSDSDDEDLNTQKTYNLSDYHPDTESGESRLSDTTEYFRPHSASIRDELPLPIPKRTKKRKIIKKTTRPIKMFNSIKKEPRDLAFETRLQQHQNMLLGQHSHHSAHMALPLVVNPLGVNWPPFAIHPLHLNDPLIMASLHTVQQVQLQKPLQQAATRGKWNSMHARIARYIQEQQSKSKVKKRKSSLSNRSGSSAFASLPVPDSSPISLLDRQFLPNPNYAHFAAHKRFKR